MTDNIPKFRGRPQLPLDVQFDQFEQLLCDAIPDQHRRVVILRLFGQLKRTSAKVQKELQALELSTAKRLRDDAAWNLFATKRMSTKDISAALGIHKEAGHKLLKKLLVERADFHGTPSEWLSGGYTQRSGSARDSSTRGQGWSSPFRREIEAVRNGTSGVESAHEAISPAQREPMATQIDNPDFFDITALDSFAVEEPPEDVS